MAGRGAFSIFPHSGRRILAQLRVRVCRTPEQLKAWRQNIGHDGVLKTFNSFGAAGSQRQREILWGFGREAPGTSTNADEIAEAVMRN